MLTDEILSKFRSRNVVVTGGSGLIGRCIVDILVDAGANTRIVSLDRININSKAQHIYGDLTNFEFCKEITRDMDFVFHVAGIKGSIEVTKSRPASSFVPLLMMNTNVLEAARLNKAAKIVYTSSIGAYCSADVFVESETLETDAPMDFFPGWAKRVAEMQVRAYLEQYGHKHFAVVRLCNVYGPGDNFDATSGMVVPSLMSRIREGEHPLLVWGDGSAVRDFAYSEDVAQGVILALHYGTQGRYVNLGSGNGVTIRELVDTLKRIIGFQYRFDLSKSSGFPKRVMDISLARKMIKYEPKVSLEEGLRKTWNWYQAHPNDHAKKINYFQS